MGHNTALASRQEEVGLTTLQRLSGTTKLNRWMFETILPHVYGRILEIGSGIGNISEQFVEAGIPISLSDLDAGYCDALQEKFERQRLVRGIYQLDLAHPNFAIVYSHLINKFDTVFALNVVEHIKDHKRAIANARSLLSPKGHLIILVPAYQTLYNGLDTGLEHFRRYTRKTLKQLLAPDFEIRHTRYFNMAGILGWFFSGAVLGKKTLPAGQLSLYHKLVPLFRVADAIIFNQVGLSVIAVGRRR